MVQKEKADFSCFAGLDMRVGRVLEVAPAATRKPTYRLRVDFGPDVGVRTSCGAFVNYAKEQLTGKLVIGVLNLGSRRMGGEVSEVLILGVPGRDGATIVLTPESDVEPGVAVF